MVPKLKNAKPYYGLDTLGSTTIGSHSTTSQYNKDINNNNFESIAEHLLTLKKRQKMAKSNPKKKVVSTVKSLIQQLTPT